MIEVRKEWLEGVKIFYHPKHQIQIKSGYWRFWTSWEVLFCASHCCAKSFWLCAGQNHTFLGRYYCLFL